MRLVISDKSFALEDVPSAVDVSDLQVRDSSRKRRRTLRAPLRDAWHIRDELARRGVRVADEEVRAAAARALEQDPVDGPLWIATYGDERAIPVLSRALDDYAPSADCAVCDYLAVFALSTAMLALGRPPTDTQACKVADYERRQRAAWLDPFGNTAAGADEPMPSGDGAPAKRTQRLGRNDPCHCGSGKKYKNCHLDLDDSRPYATRH